MKPITQLTLLLSLMLCCHQSTSKIITYLNDESDECKASEELSECIVDESLSASGTLDYCPIGESNNLQTISTSSSSIGVDYYLRNSDDNSIVDGPIAGTGGAINFSTGIFSGTKTFNVFAKKTSANSALVFDGSDDYINLSADSRGISDKITVMAWVKTSFSGAANYISGKYDGNYGYTIYITANGEAEIGGRDGTGTYKRSGLTTTLVNDGEYHMITGTIDVTTGEWKIYVDGVLENTGSEGSGTTLETTEPMRLGSLWSFSAAYFTGEIDQFAVFNTALTADKIEEFYTSCLIGDEEGIVGLYRLDVNVGASNDLFDLSPSAINVDLLGFPSDPDGSDGELNCNIICERQMSSEITYGDATAPTIQSFSNVTLPLESDGNVVLVPELINNGSTDNCNSATQLILAVDKTDFSCEDIGEQTVTFSVTDQAGNESTTTAVVTIVDDIAPSRFLQNATIQLDEFGNASLTSSEVVVSYSDNCTSSDHMIINLGQSSFTCSDLGQNTVDVIVVDASGNEITGNSIVTVEDNVVPNVVVKNISVELDQNGEASITPSDIDDGSNDNCTAAGDLQYSLNISSFTRDDIGDNIVQLTVQDASGNSSFANATVTVTGEDPLGFESDQDVLFYPNPASDQLFFQESEELEVRIFTMGGKLVSSKKVRKQIDISALDNGTYLISINNGKNKSSKRLVKTN